MLVRTVFQDNLKTTPYFPGTERWASMTSEFKTTEATPVQLFVKSSQD